MKKLIYLLLAAITVGACSSDNGDNSVITDPTESITLTADGVQKTLTRNSRGLSRAEPSLMLGFTTPFEAETLKLSTRYKKTGKNRITAMTYMFNYTDYFSTGDLQTEITANNRLQFSATFSGTFRSEEGNTVQVTQGRINTIYDEPIAATWGGGN